MGSVGSSERGGQTTLRIPRELRQAVGHYLADHEGLSFQKLVIDLLEARLMKKPDPSAEFEPDPVIMLKVKTILAGARPDLLHYFTNMVEDVLKLVPAPPGAPQLLPPKQHSQLKQLPKPRAGGEK